MNIYKLNYTNKETAIADLLAKGVYVETTFNNVTSLSYGQGVQAVVEIGKIVEVPGTYDEEGNIITEPIYYDGYAYDVMCEQEIVFESEIFLVDCKHSFMGYAQDAEGYIPESFMINNNIIT
jgi:hypothetical protein